jgi:methoxymalonate biosynthesis acyl carrier protein
MRAMPAYGSSDGVPDAAALIAQLDEMFRDVLNLAVPSPDADLIDSGLIDSLALVELLFAIEQRFSVDLAVEELEIESFRTLNRLATVIAQAQQQSRAAFQ